MNARTTALATALVLSAAAPAAASAAQLQADRACYEENTGTVAVTGNGFAPNQPYQVALDGHALPKGTGTTGPDGSIAGSFPTPELPRSAVHAYTLTVTQGTTTATTTFSVTPFLADFTPGAGNPKTLHVRFKIFGFGLMGANPIVYLHYVRPNGKLKRTLRLGRAHGVCGAIASTPRKKLFPFRAQPGKWTLQFDTQRRYRRGVTGASFLFYTVGVTIRKVYG